MSIASEITRINTNIANSYTAVDNKNGTLPQVQNSANLPSAIDSIEVIEQATAEGENISLTNTKAMPYSDYVVEGKSEQDGEPSPSNPSEIHSVADDVNLFNISKIETIGAITNNGDNTITITNSYSTSTAKKLSVLAPELKIGETYILNIETTGTNKFIYLYGTNESWNVGTTRTITQSDLDSYVFVYGNNNETVTISGIKIAKGTTLTPCSPYNQGTVTIKQRGKNLFDIENYSKSGYNVTITNPLKGLIAGDYTISCQNKHTAGSAIIFSNEINGSRIGEYFTGYDFGRTLTSKTRALTQEQLNAKYMIFQGQDSSITQEVLENMQIQIEKGSTATSYEPYQANDYTIQTAPLRSLHNGVKDTIEEEQHRKIGKQTGTLTETTTITLSDAKTNGAYMCNIKPSGTLTGKTIELEAGDYEIIYELEQETIEPLTQNQATTMLDIIKTGSYEGTTNIYTDEDVKPTIGVGYYKKS